MSETKVISVRLPTAIHHKLVGAAKDDYRSLNGEIVRRLSVSFQWVVVETPKKRGPNADEH